MPRIQFNIKLLLLITFGISIVFACFANSQFLVIKILLTVLLANVVGAIAALFVTFVMMFPRDGSMRDQDLNPSESSEV